MSLTGLPILVRPATSSDLPGILDILNAAIRDTQAIWKDEPVDLASRKAWFAERRRQNHTILVANMGDALVGFASTGDFRSQPGFRHVCENSVYVRNGCTRRGIARRLMKALIPAAKRAGKRHMVAAIGLPNEASIKLHEALGFRQVGLMPGIGVKQGQALDLCLMQLEL